MSERFFLGIDGGQSHTEAVIADEHGRIRGRGRGGPANHAEQPGGRERLARAVTESVGAALREAGLATELSEVEFEAAHCAMTGGADFKEEVIRSIVRARRLSVGHDAPAALVGATGGEPGIVVIAGTGSVAYGENGRNQSAQAGGWGYLLGDEGSGYWIAAEGLRCALRAADGVSEPTGLGALALRHFDVRDFHELTRAVYAERIDRERLATFAIEVERAAREGDASARRIIAEAAMWLCRLVVAVAKRLGVESVKVAAVGGAFRSLSLREEFAQRVVQHLPLACVIAPRFDPATGALFLAYGAAGVDLTEEILSNLEKESGR